MWVQVALTRHPTVRINFLERPEVADVELDGGKGELQVVARRFVTLATAWVIDSIASNFTDLIKRAFNMVVHFAQEMLIGCLPAVLGSFIPLYTEKLG